MKGGPARRPARAAVLAQHPSEQPRFCPEEHHLITRRGVLPRNDCTTAVKFSPAARGQALIATLLMLPS